MVLVMTQMAFISAICAGVLPTIVTGGTYQRACVLIGKNTRVICLFHMHCDRTSSQLSASCYGRCALFGGER